MLDEMFIQICLVKSQFFCEVKTIIASKNILNLCIFRKGKKNNIKFWLIVEMCRYM